MSELHKDQYRLVHSCGSQFLVQDSVEFCDELLAGGGKLARMRVARQAARVAKTPADAAVHAADAEFGVAVGAAPAGSIVP